MMGATLPLLAQHVDRTGGAGRLYAVNSGGAALGSLVAGLFLLPRIGMAATTFLAVALNVAVGLAAVRLGGRAPAPPSEPPPPAPIERPQKAAILVYALSGFAALVCEMAWTRALVLSLGSTVYAFTLILFAFILGLALGSALAARRAASLRDPLLAAGLIQLAIAGWGAGLVWVLGGLPVRIHGLIAAAGKDFLLLQLAEAGLVLALLLPPTALMGALLPVTLAAFRQEGGRPVGRAYAWNTAAAIAGTLAASFLLVPALGADLTLRAAAAVNLAAALAALWLGAAGGPRRKAWLTGAAAGLGAGDCLVPRWDPAAASIGAYFYSDIFEHALAARGETLDEAARRRRIEASYWDAFGLTTVHRSGNALDLRVNGKTDASWGTEDMAAQALITQIPLVLHPAPRDVLVIGLGSGISLANAQSHAPDTVECVEISPAVVRAAAHFAAVNGDACSRPGTRLVVGDGRAHVRYAGKSWDVIASEPSNLWVSGMANLFTVEFFREARARLKPGGIFAQWVHLYRLSPRDFRGVVRSFTEAFPQALLWELRPGVDYLLAGTVEERKWRLEEIERRIAAPDVAARLSEVQVRDAAHFLACFVMGPARLAALGAGAPPMTDDDCWIEYAAPASMLRASLAGMIDLLEEGRGNPREILETAGLDEAVLRTLDRFADSRRRLARALYPSEGKDPSVFRVAIDSILDDNPEDAAAARHAGAAGKAAFRRADDHHSAGRIAEAMQELDGVPLRGGWHVKACILRGRILEDQGRPDDARGLLEEEIRWNPKSAPARVAYARHLWRRGEKDLARAEVERALSDNPGNAAAMELREKYRQD